MPEIVEVEQERMLTKGIWSPTKAALLDDLVRDHMFDFDAVASAMQAVGHDLDATQCRLRYAQQHNDSEEVDEDEGPPLLEEVDDEDEKPQQTETTWMTGRLSPMTVDSEVPNPPPSRPFDYSRFNHIGEAEEIEELQELSAKQQKAAAVATEEVMMDIKKQREALQESIGQRGQRKKQIQQQRERDEKARLSSLERAARLQQEERDRRAKMSPEEKERQHRIDESLKIFRAQRAARKGQEAQEAQSGIVELDESEETEQKVARAEAEEDRILFAKMNALEKEKGGSEEGDEGDDDDDDDDDDEEEDDDQDDQDDQVEEIKEDKQEPVVEQLAAASASGVPSTTATPMSELNPEQMSSLTEFFLAARAADVDSFWSEGDTATAAAEKDDGSFTGFDDLFAELKDMDEAEQARQEEFDIEAEMATLQIKEILGGKKVNAATKKVTLKNAKEVMKSIAEGGAFGAAEKMGAKTKKLKGGKKKRKGKGKKNQKAQEQKAQEQGLQVGEVDEMADIAAELEKLAGTVQGMGVSVNVSTEPQAREQVATVPAAAEKDLEITDGMSVTEMMAVIEQREVRHKEKRNKIFEDVLTSLGGPLDEAIAKAELAGKLVVGSGKSGK
jgi:hypothetical protein